MQKVAAIRLTHARDSFFPGIRSNLLRHINVLEFMSLNRGLGNELDLEKRKPFDELA